MESFAIINLVLGLGTGNNLINIRGIHSSTDLVEARQKPSSLIDSVERRTPFASAPGEIDQAAPLTIVRREVLVMPLEASAVSPPSLPTKIFFSYI